MSYAITASARQAAGEGPPGKASPRKRPRTDNGGTESNQMAAHASALFVEKGSPIALAKAIKNKVDAIDVLYILSFTLMQSCVLENVCLLSFDNEGQQQQGLNAHLKAVQASALPLCRQASCPCAAKGHTLKIF